MRYAIAGEMIVLRCLDFAGYFVRFVSSVEKERKIHLYERN